MWQWGLCLDPRNVCKESMRHSSLQLHVGDQMASQPRGKDDPVSHLQAGIVDVQLELLQALWCADCSQGLTSLMSHPAECS